MRSWSRGADPLPQESTMKQIVVDANLLEKLEYEIEPVQLVDPSGRVLGVYTPDLSNFDLEEPTLTEEEERQLLDPNTKRYTTAEVLAHLERLGCSESNGPDPS